MSRIMNQVAAPLLVGFGCLCAAPCQAQGKLPMPPHPQPKHSYQIGEGTAAGSICIQNNYSGYAILIQLVSAGQPVLPGEKLGYGAKTYVAVPMGMKNPVPVRISLVGGPAYSSTFTFVRGRCYQIYYDKATMKAALFSSQ